MESDGRGELVVADVRGYLTVWRWQEGNYRMLWKSESLEQPVLAVMAEDLDQDGYPEIVAGGHGQFTVWRWAEGRGKRVWQAPAEEGTAVGHYHTGDTNGNGVPEIICRTRVYEWQKGAYRQVTALPNAVGCLHGMIVADLDSNGRAEVYQDGHSGLVALEWDGGGYKILASSRLGVMLDRIMVGTSPVLEGKKTIIVEGDKENQISMLWWDGKDIRRLSYPAAGFHSYNSQVADLDGDGRMEVVYGGATTNGAQFVKALSANNGRFETMTVSNPAVEPHVLAAGDLNNNGRAEIFCGCREGLVVLEWSGNRLAEITSSLALGQRLYFADIDGNGKMEMVSQLYGGSLGILDWQQASGLIWQGFIGDNLPEKEVPLLSGAGDLNGDGREEILFWNADRKKIYCYHWQDNQLIKLAELGGFKDFSGLFAADLDGKAGKELVVGDPGKGVSLYTWSEGGLQEKWRFDAASGYTYLAAGFMTGGRYPELLVGINNTSAESDYGAGRLYVVRWDGESYREIWRSPGLERGLSALHLADVNGDGKTDLLTRTPWSHGTEGWNDGNEPKQLAYYWDGESFRVEEPAGLPGYILAAGDVNRDRRQELVFFQRTGSESNPIEKSNVQIKLVVKDTGGYHSIWEAKELLRSAEILDLNSDGKGELILWTEDENMQIYTRD